MLTSLSSGLADGSAPVSEAAELSRGALRQRRRAFKPALPFDGASSDDPPLKITVLSDLGLQGLDARALSQNPERTALDLSDNPLLGDEGATHLSKSQNLIWLDLSRCGLTDRGVVALSQSPTLQTLKLSGNELSSASVRFLAENPVLTDLDLSGCRLGDHAAEVLFKSRSLRRLDLRGNQIENQGAKILSQDHPTLRHLNLRGNPVGKPTLFTFFARNESLWHVELDTSPFSEFNFQNFRVVQNRPLRTQLELDLPAVLVADLTQLVFDYARRQTEVGVSKDWGRA